MPRVTNLPLWKRCPEGTKGVSELRHKRSHFVPLTHPIKTEKGRRTASLLFMCHQGSARLCAFLRRQNLTTAIHAGLQVDVVRTTQFAGVLVFDVGRSLQGVSRAAHTALGRARFSLRYSHSRYSMYGRHISTASKAAETDMHQFRKLGGLIHGLTGFDQSLTAFFAHRTRFANIRDRVSPRPPARSMFPAMQLPPIFARQAAPSWPPYSPAYPPQPRCHTAPDG